MAGEPGPARLYALAAAAFLSLLGVLGFFFDSSFETGTSLASDDLAGILMVNGWRNALYLLSGMLGLAFAARAPRATALALGSFYLVLGIWGLLATERGIGSILDAVPLGDTDNALHLVLGGLGVCAALADGGLPAMPRLAPKRRGKPKRSRSATGSRADRGARRRSPGGPRRGADA